MNVQVDIPREKDWVNYTELRDCRNTSHAIRRKQVSVKCLFDVELASPSIQHRPMNRNAEMEFEFSPCLNKKLI